MSERKEFKVSSEQLEDFKDFTREKLYIEHALPVEIKYEAIRKIAGFVVVAAAGVFVWHRLMNILLPEDNVKKKKIEVNIKNDEEGKENN